MALVFVDFGVRITFLLCLVAVSTSLDTCQLAHFAMGVPRSGLTTTMDGEHEQAASQALGRLL